MYRTGPWNGVRFSGIPEMTTFEDMFEFEFRVATGGEVSYQFRNLDGSPMSRVLLNESGVMQRMVWDRSVMSWSNFWSGPRDQCDNYGRCGAFGVSAIARPPSRLGAYTAAGRSGTCGTRPAGAAGGRRCSALAAAEVEARTGSTSYAA